MEDSFEYKIITTLYFNSLEELILKLFAKYKIFILDNSSKQIIKFDIIEFLFYNLLSYFPNIKLYLYLKIITDDPTEILFNNAILRLKYFYLGI